MTTVVADISVSLDGFVTGPDAGPDNGLGTGGEPLHTWVLESDDPLDAEILATSTERSGAVVMGRNLFDVIDAPSGWSDDMGYGARHAARPPFFVVTHKPPTDVRLGLDFRARAVAAPPRPWHVRAAAGGRRRNAQAPRAGG
jgi:dihydrofolate reductase